MAQCDPGLYSLRPASYKGVPFYVDNDKEQYGRRIVTHEYPDRDNPTHEDLGEKFASYNVTGYVWGEGSEMEKEAIRLACVSQGPGLLVLPAIIPVMAVCVSCSVSRSKDKIGWFEISMEFRREGDSIGLGGFFFEGLITGLVPLAVSALALIVSERTSTANGSDYVVERQAARIESFALEAASAIEDVPDADERLSSDVNRDTVILFQAAPQLVDPDKFPELSFRLSETIVAGLTDPDKAEVNPTAPRTLVAAVAGIVEAIADSGTTENVIPVLSRLADFNPLPPDRVISPSDRADKANHEAFGMTVRGLSLIFLAREVAAKDWPNRVEAIQARADLVERFNAEIEMAGLDHAIVDTFTKARDYAAKAISDKITTTVPVVKIEANATMPSLFWAYRLYRNAARAREIADRNKLAHSGFVPSTFEALVK